MEGWNEKRKLNPQFNKYSKNYTNLVNDSIKEFDVGDHEYFTQYKILYLKQIFKNKLKEKNGKIKILDYGCGIGLLSEALMKNFPKARIDGFDISSEEISQIPLCLKEKGVFTSELSDLDNNYDYAIVCTVLHHVEKKERDYVMRNIWKKLKPGGEVIIIEHNLFNPLTKKSVENCRFDNAEMMLSKNEIRELVNRNRFNIVSSKYITFFPEKVSKLRALDKFLWWVPLGAQILVRGKK